MEDESSPFMAAIKASEEDVFNLMLNKYYVYAKQPDLIEKQKMVSDGQGNSALHYAYEDENRIISEELLSRDLGNLN